eukprot:CAMPEP_0170197448 /NCGR_PEP_ID=MMETSP0040_2-20121228/66437_1 /TAXON_ID=641309 /ORGANISM="Lotharella oceanica, Strain CCMP622" /LENGTH=201 /DNA_ID=CAMNT_0010447123 /DNA_START=63 /DNA_END=668 /DNA_ORIENTATION=+
MATPDYYKDVSENARTKTTNGYDAEGFDPVADTVGPGIYGGKVKVDAKTGKVVWGQQYQNHNKAPGPVYAGTGYTAMTQALREGKSAIDAVLKKDPKAINEITTGGATPLHMCGMSHRGQMSTAYVIEMGGEIEALDTYGYTPLHRMASNDLHVGAKALLEAGANAFKKTKYGEDAMTIAVQSRAYSVLKVLKEHLKEDDH